MVKKSDKSQLAPNVDGQATAMPKSKAKGLFLYEPQQAQAPSPADNPFRSVREAPVSTFLVDVDRASYVNLRRALSQNKLPSNSDVRIEELLNEYPSHDVAPLPSDPDPLAVHVEIAGCPWDERHRLARVGIAARPIDQKARSACNFVFLIDVSPSMRGPDRLPLLQWSLGRFMDQLGERDRLGIVAFGPVTGVVLPSTNCLEKSKIDAAVDDLTVEAPVPTRSALAWAYEIARDGFLEQGTNRVIVATDAGSRIDATGQRPDEWFGLVAEDAAKGTSLSLLGLGGETADDKTIATLAEKGRGHHARVSSPAQAYGALVNEMGLKLSAVATDAKVQVQFNPDCVSAYRPIGYDAASVPAEATLDDSQDARAIFEGHRAVAVYEIVPVDAFDLAKRSTDELRELGDRRLAALTVNLSYKKPGEGQSRVMQRPGFDGGASFNRASDDFKLAAAVAGFGLLLRQSAVPPGLSYGLVQKLVEPYLTEGRDPTGCYHEFADLVGRAKSIPVGRASVPADLQR